jgi:predicted DNA-binding transcriptional regulator AlpA
MNATITPPARRLLTVRQVAALLGITVRSVWRHTAAGLLPAPARFGQNGRVVRWPEDAILRFVEESRSAAPATEVRHGA